ncbi:MAG: hypothetical protein E7262_06615 [Lachnospiraceae bacterium]|nr:hypothetical protein [Lachnospiraceae bacterium]
MLRKKLGKAKITALAVALCMISMSIKEEGILASASSSVRYTWPVPASTTIDKKYGEGYDGIDIVSEEERSEVVVAREGTVEVAKSEDCTHINNYPDYCCNNGMGNYVKIRHSDGTYAIYAHLEHGSVAVSEGEQVEKGQKLGIMGASGRTSKNMLYFSVAYSDTKSINTNPSNMKYTFTAKDATDEGNTDDLWQITAKSGVNFRSGAGTTFQAMGKIPYEANVQVEEVIEIDDLQWGKTTYEGETGWFAMKYAKQQEQEDNNTETEEDIIIEDVYVKLKLNPNGGECECSSYVYTVGSPIIELPTPTRSGYEFVGWYTQKNEGTVINEQDEIVEDMTIYARWE